MEMDPKEAQALEMFEKLRKNIGKRVEIVYYDYGKLRLNRANLKNVIDFERVETNTMSIPFVGYGCAILSISTKEEELYSHLFTEPYDVRDSEGIARAKGEVFGERILREALAEHEKRVEADKKREEAEKKRIQAYQENEMRQLIESTLPCVKEEEKENWKKHVIINSDNMYSILVIKHIAAMLELLNQGLPCDEVEKVTTEQFQPSGYSMGCAVAAVVKFSHRGGEFKEFWDNQFGAPSEKSSLHV